MNMTIKNLLSSTDLIYNSSGRDIVEATANSELCHFCRN
jgi:hypothetical protein